MRDVGARFPSTPTAPESIPAVDVKPSIVSSIRKAVAGEDLSAAEMRAAIVAIMEGAVTPAQVAALLVALAQKGETAEELAGAAQAMRDHAIPVRSGRRPIVDVCGTGGDGSGTFNVSTAVAFVVAGAGVAVAKQGNRAMSSRCGSADVLAALGVRIDAEPAVSERALNRTGVTFLFAQTHHPAMRHVAPVRTQIGVRTLFNLLGPLTNPAGAHRQVIGVARPSHVELMACAAGWLGSERAAVVHGRDGLDEVTLAGTTLVAEWTGTLVREYEIDPHDFGIGYAPSEAIAGGDADQNARCIASVLGGEAGPHRDIVVLNAALALTIAEAAPTLELALDLARQSIDSGAARAKLAALARETHRDITR